MEFEKHEYTTEGLILYLTGKYKKINNDNPSGTKKPRKKFTKDDIGQYLIRGYLPHRYGGNKITSKKISGIRVINLWLSEKEVLSQIENPDLSGKKIKNYEEVKIPKNKKK